MVVFKLKSPIIFSLLISFYIAIFAKNFALQLQLHLLKLLIVPFSRFVINFVVKIVALYQFIFRLPGYLIELFSELNKFIDFSFCVFLLIDRFFFRFFLLFGFVSIKKLQQIWELLNVNRGQQSIVVIFQFLFSFLYEILFGISKKFFMRKLRQVVSFISQHAFLMDISHATVSLPKSPGLIILGIKYLNGIPNSAILVFGTYELYDVFTLFFHSYAFESFKICYVISKIKEEIYQINKNCKILFILHLNFQNQQTYTFQLKLVSNLESLNLGFQINAEPSFLVFMHFKLTIMTLSVKFRFIELAMHQFQTIKVDQQTFSGNKKVYFNIIYSNADFKELIEQQPSEHPPEIFFRGVSESCNSYECQYDPHPHWEGKQYYGLVKIAHPIKGQQGRYSWAGTDLWDYNTVVRLEQLHAKTAGNSSSEIKQPEGSVSVALDY